MATRAELRAALRLRLEDTSPTPLWEDAALNDALGAAMHAYSARAPVERVVSVAVPAGATSVPVTVGGSPLEARQFVAVLDATGQLVPRTREAGGDPRGPLAWRPWAGAIVLTRPLATATTWQVRYLAPRELPVDDVSAVEMVPGDTPIVVHLAAATLLRRRAVEDAKRGLPTGHLLALAAESERLAERELAARRRRVVGGWLSMSA
jgi:hypothetical protein